MTIVDENDKLLPVFLLCVDTWWNWKVAELEGGSVGRWLSWKVAQLKKYLETVGKGVSNKPF